MKVEYAVTAGEGTLIDYGLVDNQFDMEALLYVNVCEDDHAVIMAVATDDTITGE